MAMLIVRIELVMCVHHSKPGQPLNTRVFPKMAVVALEMNVVRLRWCAKTPTSVSPHNKALFVWDGVSQTR
tara:strand:+ start:1787 stop:1999 length:213 start_codon:yes stop_codon:yes gene_type:complete